MICLWAFLLLAVATSSVNSQGCSWSGAHQDVIHRHAEEGCQHLELIKVSSLNLGLVTSILSKLVNTLTNVSIVKAQVITSGLSATDKGSVLSVKIKVSITSAQYQLIDLDLIATCPFEILAHNGHAQWSQVGLIDIKLILNNKEVIGLQIIIDAILKVVSGLVKVVVETIFSSIISELNALSYTINQVLYIGGSTCSHGINSVTQLGSVFAADIYSTFGNEQTAWENYGENSLEKGELYAIGIPEKIIWKFLELWSATYLHKGTVDVVYYANQEWAGNYESLSLEISIEKVSSCLVTAEGVSVSVDVSYGYYSGEELQFSAEVGLELSGSVSFDNGYCGLSLSAHALVAADIQVTSVNSGCDCDKTILDWLLFHINHYNGVFSESLTCSLSHLIRFPVWSGVNSNKGECVNKKSYCKCTLKE